MLIDEEDMVGGRKMGKGCEDFSFQVSFFMVAVVGGD